MIPIVSSSCLEGNESLASWKSCRIGTSLSGFLLNEEETPILFGNASNPYCEGTNWNLAGETINEVALKPPNLTTTDRRTAWCRNSAFGYDCKPLTGCGEYSNPGTCDAVYFIGKMKVQTPSIDLYVQPKVYCNPVTFRLLYTTSSGFVTGRFEVAWSFYGGCTGGGCSTSAYLLAAYRKVLRSFSGVSIETAKTLAENALAAAGKSIPLTLICSNANTGPSSDPLVVAFPLSVSIICDD